MLVIQLRTRYHSRLVDHKERFERVGHAHFEPDAVIPRPCQTSFVAAAWVRELITG